MGIKKNGATKRKKKYSFEDYQKFLKENNFSVQIMESDGVQFLMLKWNDMYLKHEHLKHFPILNSLNSDLLSGKIIPKHFILDDKINKIIE